MGEKLKFSFFERSPGLWALKLPGEVDFLRETHASQMYFTAYLSLNPVLNRNFFKKSRFARLKR